MQLSVRICALVPELLGVAILGCKTWFALLQLELLPIERNGCAVEECAVKLLVAVVILLLTKLVEVEYVRTEDELVLHLLNLHVAFATHILEYQLAVGLAVLLDVGIDTSLLLGIPQLPISLAHIALGILRL